MSATDETNFQHDISASSYEPPDIPPSIISSNVVYPPKTACQEYVVQVPPSCCPLIFWHRLPILFPTIPSAGTKSRVETQIKLVFQLAIPALSSPPSLPATHDRVGTYKYLRLPDGTATKRHCHHHKFLSDIDGELEETLQMTAEVVCCSSPYTVVQSCESCQLREAKRTARKVAARVKPPGSMKLKSKTKGISKKSTKKAKEQLVNFDDMDDMDEPNVDGSILQFNCIEVLDFSNGRVILPMRITCYCRHHKEKIGFNIVFALRDHTGRLVGHGITPPILITDDHKSTNAISKLPPMHPLRQAPRLALPASVVPSPAKSEEPLSTATKRCEVQPAVKKRRPKPYDGRPNRMVGVGPGIEGRQGIVLALHPVHIHMESLPTTRSSTPAFFDGTYGPTQDVSGQGEILAQTLPGSPVSRVASPASALSQGLDVSKLQHRDLSALASQQQTLYDKSYPMYSSFSPPLDPPKIHRLIPSSGPTTGGIEITVLGSNFDSSLPLECIFGGVVASSTHRWSDNTLVCVLPSRATPGIVNVEIQGVKREDEGNACLFNYVDESDRQLMELALQVVGLKMTGKIEEARNVAMRIVGNANSQSPTMTTDELTQMNTLSETSFVHHSLLGSLGGVDLETLIIKLLTLLDVPTEDGGRPLSSVPHAIEHKNATGQTLLHLAVLLALPSLTSCLIGRSIDINAANNNGLTPLHFAAMKGWREGIEILLTEGADPTRVDLMGLTPAQRARDGGFEDLAVLFHLPTVVDGESGEDGDDEAWESEEESDNAAFKPPPSWSQPVYAVPSRVASSTYLRPASDSSEPESSPEKLLPTIDPIKIESLPLKMDHGDQKLPLGEKHDTSFVERLQRNLPQGILPHVQIPGLPQLQLPDMPWVAFPQIPVFPILVPMPNLPNLPNLPHLPNWPAFFGMEANEEKKEEREGDILPEERQQQLPFAMLWTAYDSITNNAWRAQWEKLTAHMTALQTANNGGNAELPPYTPRSEEQSKGVKASEFSAPAAQSTSPQLDRNPASKMARRVGYNTLDVPDTEVEAYDYRPKRPANKRMSDHMLVLFWIPILFRAYLNDSLMKSCD
ncbi:hypothetical protein BU17DRAFT_46834 [Hysterangium stoloniferum]|nr:hypothetical protein BU17DRAFT_46834 [Hysterangium stoloniferum]